MSAKHAVHLDNDEALILRLTANCTFEPPVSTPIPAVTAIDALRMIWYSLSVSSAPERP